METWQVTVFGEGYARIYDAIYGSKNYVDEARHLVDVASTYGLPRNSTILDVGCGTGRHAIVLAEQGFRVVGTDISPSMMNLARQRQRVGFTVATVDELRRSRDKFDLVISVFDVLSYQATIDQALAFVRSLAEFVREGGLVYFDAWHLAGLISLPPGRRATEGRLPDGSRYRRESTPSIDWVDGVTRVWYDVRVDDGGSIKRFQEQHVMRAYTRAEIELLLLSSGLEMLAVGPAGDIDADLAETHWHLGVLAKRSKGSADA